MEYKLIGNNGVKLIIGKIYSGKIFKYVFYNDTVREFYFEVEFKVKKEKILLKEFVADVNNFSVIFHIFQNGKEEYIKYKNTLHSLHLFLDVEAQKNDLIF